MVSPRAVLAALLLAVSAAAAAPSAAGGRVVRLGFVGDLMGHEVNYRMEDFAAIYRGVAPLLRDDELTFANLEFPVDPAEPLAGFPYFNGTPAYLRAAVQAGIEVFSLANNHAYDRAAVGILQTIRAIAAAGRLAGRRTYCSGTRANPRRPFAPTVVDLGGLRVGFLAVAERLNTRAGAPYVNLVDYHDRGAADALVASVRSASAGVDVFVLSYHGDGEYSAEPEAGKVSFFARLAAAGAHIVFAHHPHVLQAPRWVHVGGSDRLILPSMGNFISGMTWRLDSSGNGALADTGESAIARVQVQCTGGRATVTALELVPVANYRDARGKMVIARLADLATADSGLPPAWVSWFSSRLVAMEQRLGIGR